jgi:hypothetical protein
VNNSPKCYVRNNQRTGTLATLRVPILSPRSIIFRSICFPHDPIYFCFYLTPMLATLLRLRWFSSICNVPLPASHAISPPPSAKLNVSAAVSIQSVSRIQLMSVAQKRTNGRTVGRSASEDKGSFSTRLIRNCAMHTAT